MALEGPALRYTRSDETPDSMGAVVRALRLAREIEELLDRTREAPSESGIELARQGRSTRMARALAASLVDELNAVERRAREVASMPPSRTGVA